MLKFGLTTGQNAMMASTLRVTFPPGTSAPANLHEAEIALRSDSSSNNAATPAPPVLGRGSSSGAIMHSGGHADSVRSPLGLVSPGLEGLGTDRFRTLVEDGALSLPPNLSANQRVDILFPVRVPAGTTTHPVRLRRREWATGTLCAPTDSTSRIFPGCRSRCTSP